MLRVKNGQKQRVWQKTRARNEALDVRVYALSAFVNLNANLDQLAKALKASMNAKLKPRKQTRSKPSSTGRRAAKVSSTVGRPDELKILNLTYKVIFSSQDEMIVSGAMGFCSVDAQLIVVAEDQANDAMQDTFLHEVMHALTAAFDLNGKTKRKASCADWLRASARCGTTTRRRSSGGGSWFSCQRLSI